MDVEITELGKVAEPPKKRRACSRSPILDAVAPALMALKIAEAFLVAVLEEDGKEVLDVGAVSRAVEYANTRWLGGDRKFTVRANDEGPGVIVWRKS